MAGQREIVIVDNGEHNVYILKCFNRLNIPVVVSSDPAVIATADKLILAGVGHFGAAMKNLREMDIIDLLNRRVLIDKVPILGICLGIQLFTSFSEEDDCEGLGWLNASTIRFRIKDSTKYRVPHMGWTSAEVKKKNPLNEAIKPDSTFYFDHSYHIECEEPEDIWLVSNYEYKFASGVQKENIYGVQFCPEKSLECGSNLFKYFALI